MEDRSNVKVCLPFNRCYAAERPWAVNGVVSHSYKKQPQHCLVVFIDILVLPVHSEPPFLGGFQGEDLPTKQPTMQILGQLWDSSSLSFLLWLCFPAVDWSVYGSVSDWWSLTSRHVSSAAPMLPPCLETLNRRKEVAVQRLLHKLVFSGWNRGDFLSPGHSLNSTSLLTFFFPQYFLFTDTIWFS